MSGYKNFKKKPTQRLDPAEKRKLYANFLAEQLLAQEVGLILGTHGSTTLHYNVAKTKHRELQTLLETNPEVTICYGPTTVPKQKQWVNIGYLRFVIQIYTRLPDHITKYEKILQFYAHYLNNIEGMKWRHEPYPDFECHAPPVDEIDSWFRFRIGQRGMVSIISSDIWCVLNDKELCSDIENMNNVKYNDIQKIYPQTKLQQQLKSKNGKKVVRKVYQNLERLNQEIAVAKFEQQVSGLSHRQTEKTKPIKMATLCCSSSLKPGFSFINSQESQDSTDLKIENLKKYLKVTSEDSPRIS